MGKPRGYQVPREEREKIAASQRERWAASKPWIDASRGILAAANAGDHAQASALLWEYIDEHAAEHAQDQAVILNMSQAERRAIFAQMALPFTEGLPRPRS